MNLDELEQLAKASIEAGDRNQLAAAVYVPSQTILALIACIRAADAMRRPEPLMEHGPPGASYALVIRNEVLVEYDAARRALDSDTR